MVGFWWSRLFNSAWGYQPIPEDKITPPDAGEKCVYKEAEFLRKTLEEF